MQILITWVPVIPLLIAALFSISKHGFVSFLWNGFVGLLLLVPVGFLVTFLTTRNVSTFEGGRGYTILFVLGLVVSVGTVLLNVFVWGDMFAFLLPKLSFLWPPRASFVVDFLFGGIIGAGMAAFLNQLDKNKIGQIWHSYWDLENYIKVGVWILLIISAVLMRVPSRWMSFLR